MALSARRESERENESMPDGARASWKFARQSVLRSSIEEHRKVVLRRFFTLTRIFSLKSREVITHPQSKYLPEVDKAKHAKINQRREAFVKGTQEGSAKTLTACWTSGETLIVEEGVFEDRNSVNARRTLRLLPEVTKLVESAWEACGPVMGRITLPLYMDYHLSCYRYIQEKEGMARNGKVDLMDAWECAVSDWLTDSEDSVKQVNKRVLHFELFRDSIFQLIDLYTPTLEERQYVKYLHILVNAVTVTKGGRPREIRFRWHKTRASPEATELCTALRKEWVGQTPEQTEKAVETIYNRWLKAQQLASSPDDGDDSDVDEEDALTELTPAGLAAGSEMWISSFRGDSGSDEKRIDLFRRFDIDATGLVSLANFKAVLVDDAPSMWLQADSKGRGKALKKVARKLSVTLRLSKLALAAGAAKNARTCDVHG